MLRHSTAVVVRTRPRAIPLAMITMRKSTHGFSFDSHIWVAYGAPLSRHIVKALITPLPGFESGSNNWQLFLNDCHWQSISLLSPDIFIQFAIAGNPSQQLWPFLWHISISFVCFHQQIAMTKTPIVVNLSKKDIALTNMLCGWKRIAKKAVTSALRTQQICCIA